MRHLPTVAGVLIFALFVAIIALLLLDIVLIML